LATQAEIEAAADAIAAAEERFAVGKLTAETYATLALEASERVRPRRDLTAAARMRQFRAKRRAERAVTPAATPERAVTGDVTRAVTAPLLARLLSAASDNVQPVATDTSAITAPLEQGCDLDLDVLPAVHDLLRHPLQPPLKSWGLPWLAKEIIRRRDARTTPDRVAQAPAAARAAQTRQPAPAARASGECGAC
jgi:hypothetical protein